MAAFKLIFSIAAISVSMLAQAEVRYQTAEVIYSVPVYERVAISQPDFCQKISSRWRQQQKQDLRNGALAGGALGAIVAGTQSDRLIDIATGAIIGGAVGSAIADHSSQEPQQGCRGSQHVKYSHELIGWDVKYVLNGREYSGRMNNKPGRFVQVQVAVSLVD